MSSLAGAVSRRARLTIGSISLTAATPASTVFWCPDLLDGHGAEGLVLR